ncbi:hypothetical protein B0H10DRAFT_1846664, partial [Mycena sp. CBHHK59/15]
ISIIQAYIIFHLRRNPKWNANKVDEQTPRDIATFITKNVALRGLPTRSRHVSQFMVGLEKTKAKSGEVSLSARALSLDDIH